MTSFLRKVCILALLLSFVLIAGERAFAQTETIDSLTAAIEKSPQQAENYLKRAMRYKNSRMLEETALENTALAVADYTSYLKLNPKDAEVYRLRAETFRELFRRANQLTLADLKRGLQIAPQNNSIRERLAELTGEYRAFLASPTCRDAKRIDGFQGHPSDEPLTYLAQSLEPEMEEDAMIALRYIACGANVNRVYPRTGQPEFSNFASIRVEHLIALLEAGANPNRADRSGSTPLMNTLAYLRLNKAAMSNKILDKFKLVLRYGANPNARNRRGQTVLSFASRTRNKELIELLRKAGAK